MFYIVVLLKIYNYIVYIARNSIAIEDLKCIYLTMASWKAETYSKVLLEITNVIP
jgi:hypothetical protein